MKHYSSTPMSAALLALAAAFCLTLQNAGPVSAQSVAPPLALRSGWTLEDAAKITTAGEEISQPDYQPDHDWHEATVPGTVLTSLVNDGIYPEPLYGENNRPDKIPESLCRASYWYRTAFTVPAPHYAGQHIWLRFDGINYAAEVWLNGHSVGPIKGAFARGNFDITAFATPGKRAALAVKISPQPNPGTPLEQTVANGTGPNGGITASDGPTFLSTIGWDWIPGIRDRDTGIWQDVTLYATGPVTVQDPYVTTTLPLPRMDSADVTVQTTLKNVTGGVQSGELTASFGAAIVRQKITLQPNETKVVTLSPVENPALHLKNPRLWWPNGYGAPNLYQMHLAFSSGLQVSDSKDVSFGIRKISYTVPGTDNLTISVNGVPVVCKGGDWGMDEAMKRNTPERLDAQVRLHRDAHCTMIRNWVGQSTSEDFYNACDRYGILIWDEFFQANPSDGPKPNDTDLYLANVREKLLRFRNHPSIAVWCARNEGNPPPDIDTGIAALIAELEKDRLYQKNSADGRGVHSGGPYFWRTPREYYDIDAPFKTEIGSVSIPTLESIKAMMPEKDWGVINDDWAEHDLCRGAQAGDRYPRQLTERYGPIASLADFARKGQLANYEAFRAMYEGRLVKLFRPTTGILTWMSNPSQPSFVWQLYSHDLEPNSSLFAVREACEPLHIMMSESDGHISVINNLANARNDLAVRTTIYNLDGTVAQSDTRAAQAPASTATDLGAIPLPARLSPVHFVRLELLDSRGKPVSNNFYWQASASEPDNFQALSSLPTVRLQQTTSLRREAGRVHVEVTLSNPGTSIALMAHLQLRRHKSGERVLPVFYSDNYISLVPGETRTIQIDAAERDLGADQPEVAVDGWNVDVAPSVLGSAHPVAVTTNRDAAVPPSALGAVAVTAAAHPARLSINIDCGGSGAGLFTFGKPISPDDFLADAYFRGGQIHVTDGSVDTSVPNAGPAYVYKSERLGPCRYFLQLPRSGAATRKYTVRLHFAETTFQQPGQRKFNVDINNAHVLTDFDIISEAGAPAKALVKEFLGIAPNERSGIVITLSNGSADQPEIRGIQVIGE